MSETTISQTDPQPNIPLLRKVVEWVEAEQHRTEDREWYQGAWIIGGEALTPDINWCKTACCVAGKIALMEGYEPEANDEGQLTGDVVDPKTEAVYSTEEIARKALGLAEGVGEGVGMTLFDGVNTAADIRHIAEDIAGERL